MNGSTNNVGSLSAQPILPGVDGDLGKFFNFYNSLQSRESSFYLNTKLELLMSKHEIRQNYKRNILNLLSNKCQNFLPCTLSLLTVLFSQFQFSNKTNISLLTLTLSSSPWSWSLHPCQFLLWFYHSLFRRPSLSLFSWLYGSLCVQTERFQ